MANAYTCAVVIVYTRAHQLSARLPSFRECLLFFFFFRKIRKQHPACLLLTTTPFSLPATRLEISPPRDCQHLLLSSPKEEEEKKKKNGKQALTFLIFISPEETESFLPLDLLTLSTSDAKASLADIALATGEGRKRYELIKKKRKKKRAVPRGFGKSRSPPRQRMFISRPLSLAALFHPCSSLLQPRN